MFNLDDMITKNDNKDWPYRSLVTGPSGSGKTKYLLNSIQKDNNVIDKIYLYAKDLEEPKVGIKTLKDKNALTKYSNNMDDIHDDFNDYNKKNKEKSFTCF